MYIILIQLLLSLSILAYSHVCLANVRGLDFDLQTNTTLDGKWKYFPHNNSSHFDQDRDHFTVNLPNSFQEMVGTPNQRGHFVQTFRLPETAVGQPIALFLPYQYGAYSLYINDKLALKVGTVGDQQQHVTQLAPRLLIFSVDQSELHMRLDFSSYDHIRGGPENSIVIGYEEPIRRYFYQHIIPSTWVSGMLIMISLFMALFAVYRLRHHQPVLPLLFLSLFILCFSVRSFFAVPFSYTLFTSINWLWGTRIEYLLTGLVSLFFLTYIRLALPHLLNRTIYIFLSGVIFANFFMILTQTPLVSQAFFFKTFIFSSLLFINLLYGVYRIFKHKSKFSKSNALLISVVCLTFIHDYLLSINLIDSVEIAFYTSCIYFIVVTLQLSRDYALQSDQAIAYNQELVRLNRNLDQQVAERTHTVIQLNEQLQRQLKLDSLTGAYNRYALNETLQQYFTADRQVATSVGFFMLDVDYFKNYNDCYGHLKGDEVLQKIVIALQQQLPQDGFLARYGGEEFVIILPHIDVIGAQRFAEKCLVTLRKLNLVHQQRLDDKQIVTMSIGGALMDHSKHYSNADALIRCADLRLYQAKQQRDCAIVN